MQQALNSVIIRNAVVQTRTGSARADTNAQVLRERSRGLTISELAYRQLIDISFEVHVLPVIADVLPFYHHVVGQTPLHTCRPLPAVHNGKVIRGIGDKPISLTVVVSRIAAGNNG